MARVIAVEYINELGRTRVRPLPGQGYASHVRVQMPRADRGRPGSVGKVAVVEVNRGATLFLRAR